MKKRDYEMSTIAPFKLMLCQTNPQPRKRKTAPTVAVKAVKRTKRNASLLNVVQYFDVSYLADELIGRRLIGGILTDEKLAVPRIKRGRAGAFAN